MKQGRQQALIEASPQDCFDAITDYGGAGLRPCGAATPAARPTACGGWMSRRGEAPRLDAGVWMPGPVKKILSDQVMKRSVEDLKRRVESLSR